MKTIRFGRHAVRNKRVLTAVFMFVLVVVLVHFEIPEALAQEFANASSGGIASQSVTPISHPKHDRLAASGSAYTEGKKLDAPRSPVASQATVRADDGAVASLDNGMGENEKCDCAQQFFPQSGIDLTSTQ
jgi:hypothetical protein